MASKSETRAVIREFDSRANNKAVILENGIDDYWRSFTRYKIFSIRQARTSHVKNLRICKITDRPPFGNAEHCLGTTHQA